VAPTSVTIDINALETKAASIKEIDAKLASANGNEKQAIKAVTESLVAENAESIDGLLNKVLDQLAKQDLTLLIGIGEKFSDAFNDKFGEKITEIVSAKVAETTTTLSKDEVNALREQRKNELGQFRALKDILDSVGVDTSAVEEPKRAGGGGGKGGSSSKSGKNREGYQFTLDGKDRPVSQNTFSSLAYYATTGCPKAAGEMDDEKARWGTAQLKEFIASQNVKFGEDETWEVTLPNGRKVGARRVAELEAASSSDEAEAADAGTPEAEAQVTEEAPATEVEAPAAS
jgi:hypothetical protein